MLISHMRLKHVEWQCHMFTIYTSDCQMFRIIKSMYSNIKSCVRHNNQLSEMFNCNEGLMQGESLSPFLFSLHVNDFEMEFIENTCVPVENYKGYSLVFNYVCW
jgi:hypothetical protein